MDTETKRACSWVAFNVYLEIEDGVLFRLQLSDTWDGGVDPPAVNWAFLVYIAIGSVRDNIRDKIPLEVKEEEDTSSNTVEQQIWLLAVHRSFLLVP